MNTPVPTNDARDTKRVYLFAEGNASMKDLLGGKGANLAEMTNAGLPVPPGFTIPTTVCNEYYAQGERLPAELWDEVHTALATVEAATGRRFGDPAKPLLVSVRSGAKFSMPGMMDTILNLGLNDETVQGIIDETGNERFAYDAYRRFIAMFSNVVLNFRLDNFEHLLEQFKHRLGVRLDTDLDAQTLREVVGAYKALVVSHLGIEFPTDPKVQLRMAVEAVFKSWNNDRAITYRNHSKIAHDLGTAVNIQAMVFGNMGNDSGTGVAFTRNPSTGEKGLYGEYLTNAQGEDVVAGIRTPKPIAELQTDMPEVYSQFLAIAQRLETHYKDMQDLEFTVEKGKLYMLQTRNGKRTAQAAVTIAVEMANDGLIAPQEALLRVEPNQLNQLLHRRIDPAATMDVIARGLPASPGAATGAIVFEADDAERLGSKGQKVILVRVETNPDDIHGMIHAQGVLTSRGGMTCVAGETRVLTDQGFLAAEDAFDRLEAGQALRILSVDAETLQPIWRRIIAAGRKPAEVMTIAVSQTGRAAGNHLRMTADHKMMIFSERRLVKKRLDEVLRDGDFLTVLDRVPGLDVSSDDDGVDLAYVAGVLFSDGYINVEPTKGSITFIQKPTDAKQAFILAVEQSFERAFSVDFSYMRNRETVATLRGREVHGAVQDRICYRRGPAVRLAAIRDNLCPWVLGLERPALLAFLAGYVDGDGSYSADSSAVRLQIVVAKQKRHLLDGLALACLRLGIVPQVSRNRDAYLLQIVERVTDILEHTHRVKAEIPAPHYASKCLSARALFADMADGPANRSGRVKSGVKRNIMFGADKIARDYLPLCPPEVQQRLAAILKSPLRSYRVRRDGEDDLAMVYNFEVDADDELDKNFVVFSSRMTPVVVSNSHAAVVARGMGKPCVAGTDDIEVDLRAKELRVAGRVLREGDILSINGGTGEVIQGEVPMIEPELSDEFRQLMLWADEYRTLGVRTNADTPEDAAKARGFGAEGVGLCRTEHMFMAQDRLPVMQEMILAGNERDRRAALERLLPMQRDDFRGIFQAMAGLSVTIRLLDPPLHEFLPKQDELIAEVAVLRVKGDDPTRLVRLERLLKEVQRLHESNPMMGLRGCRLGLTFPEINEMQVRAIFEAACELKREGVDVLPEVMIPLVGHVNELARVRAQLEQVAKATMEKAGVQVDYKFGTMIEIPRAALTADQIATEAQFFSFGTNDLTQMTFGYSRDDAEGKFLTRYLDSKILPNNPFEILDREGVGALMRIAVEKGRATNPTLKLGVCGEHGGEPSSIEFCHQLGLDYVSCSPFRVPIARLAAAQAALADQQKERDK
ncbi:MAG: pyruvate, phosphate dikinase [Candidatus Sericytochromatia bacterium]